MNEEQAETEGNESENYHGQTLRNHREKVQNPAYPCQNNRTSTWQVQNEFL